MTERYCEGERFADLSFTEETFEDCDFTDCVFVDCSFAKCELDHTTLNECKFVRCEITGLRSTHSSVQSLDFEDCRLNEIEWAPLMSNGAFPDPIHTLKECSLKYNTFTSTFRTATKLSAPCLPNARCSWQISRAWNFTKRNSTSVTCARRISGMLQAIRWTFWAAA